MPAHAPVAVFWGANQILFYNDAFARYLGAQDQGVLGRTLGDSGLATWKELSATIEHVRTTGETVAVRDCSCDASWDEQPDRVFFDVSCSPIPDGLESGGVLCICVETTSHRVAAAKRDEAAELLRVAQKAGGVGTFHWWPKTNVLDVSDECRAIFGLDPSDVVTVDRLISLIHPDDRLLAMHQPGEPDANPVKYAEYRIRRADNGDERWVARLAEWVSLERGGARFAGVVVDITRQKETEAALRASEAHLLNLNATLEQFIAERTRERDRMWHVSQDAFVVFDRQFNHVTVSPAFQSLLGWPLDEIVGHPSHNLTHPDDIERAHVIRAQLLSGQVVHSFENRALHKDGTWRWLAWTAVPDQDRIYAVARDITGLKARFSELATANAELRAQIEAREHAASTMQQMQRLEAIGQLTTGIAHDFNNMLTVIMGNLEVLGRRAAASGEQRRIALMQAAAARGAKLTSQLLAFSRRQRLNAEMVNLNELIASMRDLLDSSVGSAAQLVTKPAPFLWPAMVDRTQIELVILNLITNARDATVAGGSVAISTDNITLAGPDSPPGFIGSNAATNVAGDLPEPGDYVMVTVADEGAGMTAEISAKAFEPFFTTKEVGRGAGLGLAQVYGFTRQSGGGVVIHTQPGRGTVVRVYVPRAHTEPTPTAVTPYFDGTTARTDLPRRILLVDDDAAVRDVTAALLCDMGFEVVEAASGHEALTTFEAPGNTFDLVLLDFVMPEMNGTQLARRIRDEKPGTRVIFVTGYATLPALGPTDEAFVLLKPFRESELKDILARAMSSALQDDVAVET